MIQDTVKDKFDTVRGLSTDDVLSALGLERRRAPFDVMLPAAGMFLAGIFVGAGVAFLLAPKSGRETRRELKNKATDLTRRISSSAESLAQDVFGGEDESRAQKMGEGGNDRERRLGETHRSVPAHTPNVPHTPNQPGGPQK